MKESRHLGLVGKHYRHFFVIYIVYHGFVKGVIQTISLGHAVPFELFYV